MDSAVAVRLLNEDQHPIFSNAHPIWRQPGNRSIYGGALVAQCLEASRRTVGPDFCAHSVHCNFVQAGSIEQPVNYHVEKLRDGKNFSLRLVRAKQGQRCLLTASVSYTVLSPKTLVVSHAPIFPGGISSPSGEDSGRGSLQSVISGPGQPFELVNCPSEEARRLGERKTRRWMRAKGPLSKGTHAAALAYMSDYRFIGVTARAHQLSRFSREGYVEDTLRTVKGNAEEQKRYKQYLEAIAQEELQDNRDRARTEPHVQAPVVQSAISLDHSIYFHNPPLLQSNDWLCVEMDSLWSGLGRGLVSQRIWTKEGVLVATCIQEGMITLEPDKSTKLARL